MRATSGPAVAAYHKAIFEDHHYFGLYRDLDESNASETLRDLSWLIAYVDGAKDLEIAAREYDVTKVTVETETLRRARERLMARIELKLADRRGR